MKLQIVITGLFLLFMNSCEKKSTTTVDEKGNTTTVETVGFDKQRIDSTAEKVEAATQKAADKTGDALKDAGAAIKKEGEKLEQKRLQKSTKTDTVLVK